MGDKMGDKAATAAKAIMKGGKTGRQGSSGSDAGIMKRDKTGRQAAEAKKNCRSGSLTLKVRLLTAYS